MNVRSVLCDEHGWRNWQWIIETSEGVILIDPGYRSAIDALLADCVNSEIAGIVVTHTDNDHIAELPHYEKLSKRPPIMPSQSEAFTIAGLTFRVISTPGHVSQHVSYMLETPTPYLFAGDALFVGGCGRVFTGDYATMDQSLNRIKQLDPAARLCGGHDLIGGNYAFIDVVDPNNTTFSRLRAHLEPASEGTVSGPQVTLGDELDYNPFLRLDSPAVAEALKERFGHVPAESPGRLKLLREYKEGL